MTSRRSQNRQQSWLWCLLLAMPGPVGIARAQDNRDLCLQWSRSHGAAKVALANTIGAQNLLTKVHKLAEAQPGDRQSLYSSNDIQRLCRRL